MITVPSYIILIRIGSFLAVSPLGALSGFVSGCFSCPRLACLLLVRAGEGWHCSREWPHSQLFVRNGLAGSTSSS
jgi:hypothetical protein